MGPLDVFAHRHQNSQGNTNIISGIFRRGYGYATKKGRFQRGEPRVSAYENQLQPAMTHMHQAR
jgi:hypothetical protein